LPLRDRYVRAAATGTERDRNDVARRGREMVDFVKKQVLTPHDPSKSQQPGSQRNKVTASELLKQ
jgi:hypothetical protein